MFDKIGFLGTQAPLFMDIITVYFAVMPILLLVSIYFAIKKKYQLHFISQGIILTTALVITVFFEIGVRITGVFSQFAKTSYFSYETILIFLIIHIIIAILAVGGWLYLFISSYKRFKLSGYKAFENTNHKKIGMSIFLALTVSSVMGICIYLALFVIQN